MLRKPIPVPLAELELNNILASGPGGQNVNKVATAVQLRFDVRRSQALTEAVRSRLEALAGNRVSRDGVLVMTSRRFRTREANRRDVLARLQKLLQRAAEPPKKRIRTKPPAKARERRLENKRRRSGVKSLRKRPPPES